MTTDKQPQKLRLWAVAVLFSILSIFAYIKHDRVLSPYETLSNDTRKTSLAGSQRLNNILKEGFVTFCDNNTQYFQLLLNLLDSVHHFSTRPIMVFGIDIDLDIDLIKYPRVIKRRLKKSDCGSSIYFCKIHAIIESQLDYGVQIDADSIVNWNIDILFDVVHRWPYPLPLAPRHPSDPNNYDTFLKLFEVDAKNRIIPYVHAQFSWNYRAYPFFKRALQLMREGRFPGANFDETAINILLWKANANHTLCKIDPYISYISDYESQEKICKQYCFTAFVIFHGSKSEVQMSHALYRLKKHAGLPFIQTLREGLHYLNETDYSCCYPDSDPSPIHPLICQYPARTT